MLTGRGWGLLGAAAACVVVGGAVGIEELYGLAAAAVGLVGAAAAWAHGRDWRLDVERAARPPRVPAGEAVEVRVAATAAGGRPTPPVELLDPFDGGARLARLALPPLPAGGSQTGGYRLPPVGRGVHTIGPLEVVLRDPFGVVALRRPAAPQATVTVLPRLERLVSLPPTGGDDHRRGTGSSALHGGGGEYYGVREYRTGDDLRLVHWGATAHTGELAVRQEERRQRGLLTVLLDLRGGWEPAALETGVSAAASVAALGRRGGLDVRLLDTAGLDTGVVGARGGHDLLDPLARARPGPGATPAATLRAAGVRPVADAVVVVLPSAAAADLAAVAALGAWGPLLTAILVEPAGTPPLPGVPGVVRVPAGDRLAPLWDAAVAARGGGRAGG